MKKYAFYILLVVSLSGAVLTPTTEVSAQTGTFSVVPSFGSGKNGGEKDSIVPSIVTGVIAGIGSQKPNSGNASSAAPTSSNNDAAQGQDKQPSRGSGKSQTTLPIESLQLIDTLMGRDGEGASTAKMGLANLDAAGKSVK